MPIVAEVDGVRIAFYANEHPPPHFHTRIAEHQAVVDIETLTVTDGFLAIAKRSSVLAWAATRQAASRRAFIQATGHGKVEPIA